MMSPNVCPLSSLILNNGVSVPSEPLSHQVTYTLSPSASISVRSDTIPFDSLKLISLPNVLCSSSRCVIATGTCSGSGNPSRRREAVQRYSKRGSAGSAGAPG